jgi:hypothetical protein
VIENLASYTPVSVRVSEERAALINSVEDNRETYCKALLGKPPYNALYGTYTMTLTYFNKVLKASTQQEKGFKEVRRQKRHYTEAPYTVKKVALAPSVKVFNKELLHPTPDNEHGH